MIKKFATIFFSFVLLSMAFGSLAQNSTTTPPNQKKKIDIVCVRGAVEKRENAIQSAWDTATASIRSALQTRKTEVLAAWNIEDQTQRKAALKDAWTKFRKAKREATAAHKKARQATWSQFKKDRAACGHGATGENPGDDISF